MNPISYPVAQSIVLCYENIKNCKVITTQTFDDTYKVGEIFVNRQIAIASKMRAGKVETSFKITETYPDRVVVRVEIDNIDSAVMLNDKFGISSDSYMFTVDVTTIAPEPAVEPEPVPESPVTI